MNMASWYDAMWQRKVVGTILALLSKLVTYGRGMWEQGVRFNSWQPFPRFWDIREWLALKRLIYISLESVLIWIVSTSMSLTCLIVNFLKDESWSSSETCLVSILNPSHETVGVWHAFFFGRTYLGGHFVNTKVLLGQDIMCPIVN